MKGKRATYFFCALLMLMCVSIFAKEPEPPSPKPDGPSPPGLPIDGGVTIFLFVGAAYGVYALKKKQTIFLLKDLKVKDVV